MRWINQFNYAATKSNELIAYNYRKLFLLPTTGLRFFTVYGPWEDPTWHYLCLWTNDKGKKKMFLTGEICQEIYLYR